jgi:beta-alanine--pyruvate transaminase
MGAVMVRKPIYEAIVERSPAPEKTIELFHGYTYSAHPIACAAALAVLETYKEERLFERAAALAPIFEERLHALAGKPHVIDIRNIGLMGAVELAPRPGRPGERAYDAMCEAFEAGLMIRVTGDTIALSPPLIATEADIARITDILGGVLDRLD